MFEDQPNATAPDATDFPAHPAPKRSLKLLLISLGTLTALTLAGLIGYSVRTPKLTPVATSASRNLLISRLDRSVVDITATDGYQQAVSSGTGIILSANGYVLTNNHVIVGATTIIAKIAGGSRVYSAVVVGYDASKDLAVLKLQGATSLLPAQLSPSSSLSIGEAVVAIGNTLALPGLPTVTHGTITALGRSVTVSDQLSGSSETLTHLIQIDAPLAPGNSGGPLLNRRGQVIGINTAASLAAGTPSNVGFAIPASEAIPIALAMIAGRRSRGVHLGPTAMLGVTVTTPSSIAASGFAYAPRTPTGAVVISTLPGSPAARAHLLPGDIIIRLAGTTILSPSQMAALISHFTPNRPVTITWVTPLGNIHSTSVKLTTGPPR
jgi:S1-C subfamily serine protease